MARNTFALHLAVVLGWLLLGGLMGHAAEPPAINPFGTAPSEREDAVPGCLELSDGSIHPGMIYLTRDARLKVYDEKLERQREVPLQAVKQIECKVKKEWMEKEWTFKETTSDEKIYTGRSYPSREYLHTLTLHDGRTIAGPLSAIIYVQPKRAKTNPSEQADDGPEAERFSLNKRNKGELGQKLDSLVYVQRIKLGKEALEEGLKESEKSSVKPQAAKSKKLAKPQAVKSTKP